MLSRLPFIKKVDKLILKAFVGPFLITFLVVVFILLVQMMLRYFEDFFGKGLSLWVFLKMFFYFSLNTTPIALPLAILLSSLITFGNLGEHFELTAVKSAGISLIRTLRPIFLLATALSFISFFINDTIVPLANLKAYSLLYDIRQKKPTVDFKEGTFYNGLDGYSVRMGEKFSDGKTFKNIMIYDHTKGNGNVTVILADSGQMYSIFDDRYLKMDLFNGGIFTEDIEQNTYNPSSKKFIRSEFKRNELLFSLESFDLKRTREELFLGNRIMKNTRELTHDIDSITKEEKNTFIDFDKTIKLYYIYHYNKKTDSIASIYSPLTPTSRLTQFSSQSKLNILDYALTNARNIKSLTDSYTERHGTIFRDLKEFQIEKYKKITQAITCLLMFLIGAPLGSIIKRGGVGIPVLISIGFFILSYVITIMSEKWTKEGLVMVEYSSWAATAVLLPIGLLFLMQARNDVRLFDRDFYLVWLGKIKNWLFLKFKKGAQND